MRVLVQDLYGHDSVCVMPNPLAKMWVSTCTSKFTLEEVTKVYECLPLLKKKMPKQGELFECDYECLGMTAS